MTTGEAALGAIQVIHSGSDTESEHESHTGCHDGAFGSLRLSRSALSTSTGKNITESNESLRDLDALSAIEQIKSVDVSTVCHVCFHPSTGLKTIPYFTVCQDIDTHDITHKAYSAIIGFLDDACTVPLLKHHSAKALAVFIHLGMGCTSLVKASNHSPNF
jgi:hypothetical protein